MKHFPAPLKIVFLGLCAFLLAGCTASIDGITQPEAVAPGETVSIELAASTASGGDVSGFTIKPFLAILIPDDWTVTSVISSEGPTVWTSASSVPHPTTAPAGYTWSQWQSSNSGSGAFSETISIEATAGTTTGIFTLRYYAGLAGCDEDQICQDPTYTGDMSQEIRVGEASNPSQKASITSWDYSVYEKPGQSCVQRLRMTVTGKRFEKNAEVRIGSVKAKSVERKSSKELVAKFCLEKFSQNSETIKKTLSVKNPGSKAVIAEKRVDLTIPKLVGNTGTSFNQSTKQGVMNIQKVLVSQKVLSKEDVTGMYGPSTVAAVKKFQQAHGIYPTGNVGPKTIAAFQKILKKK